MNARPLVRVLARSLVPALAAVVPGLALSCGSGGGAGDAPRTEGVADVARLVPSDAIAFVQIASIDALEREVNALQEAATGEEGGAGGADVRMLLSLLAPGVDLSGVQGDRPLGMAVSWSGTPMPVTTLVLPVDDPETFAAEQRIPGAAQPVAEGGWVALPSAPELDLASPRRELARDLLAGTLTLRVDLGRLIEEKRETIDQGLAMMTAFASDPAMQQASPGVSMEAVAEMYADVARAVLDSATTLDLAARADGETLVIEKTLATKPGSPMAELLADAGGDGGGELRFDEDASMHFALRCDASRLWDAYAPFLDTALEMYPEPLRGQLARLIRLWEPLMHRLGSAHGASADFGPQGIRATYVLEADDPAAFLEAFAAEVSAGEAAPDVTAETKELRVAGEDVACLVVAFDLSSWREMVQEEAMTAEAEQLDAMFRALYGGDELVFRLFPLEEALVMTLGADEEAALAAVERALGSAGAPSAIAPLLARLDGAEAGFALSMDLGRTMEGMRGFWQMAGGGPDLPEDLPAVPVTMHGEVADGVWSGGATVDLGGFGAFARAMDGR